MTDFGSPPPAPTEFGDYVAVVRRRAFLVVGVTLLVSAAGLLIADRQAPPAVEYRATTEIAPPFSGVQLPPLEPEVEFARSDRVETAALGVAGPVDDSISLDRDVEIRAVPERPILSFAVTADDPETARLISASLSEAYLQERVASLEEQRRVRLDSSTVEIQRVTDELREQTDLLSSSEDDSPAATSAAALVSVLQNQLTRLRGDTSVLLLEPLDRGVVTTSTTVEELGGSGIPAMALIGVSVALGLLVALVAAFVVDRLDPSVRSTGDVQRLLGNVIGEIPFTLDVLEPGNVPESLQRTATAARFAAAGGGRSALVLAGVVPESAASRAIDNIAVAHVETGRHTMLLSLDDGDTPLPERSGLVQVRLPLPRSAHRDGIDHAMEKELASLGDGTAFVHCRPVLSSPDACDLAATLGVLVVVARVGRTRRDDLEAAALLAERAGVQRCWTVVERAPTIRQRLRRTVRRSTGKRNTGQSDSSEQDSIAA